MWPFSRNKNASSRPSGGARKFDAAAFNRFVSSWTATSNTIDQELRSDLDALRRRSRDLAKNNDYVRKFLVMCANNIVGPQGFKLQSAVQDSPDKPDDAANDAIEAAFARWCAKGICETTGKLSFTALQRVGVKSAARDGELIWRMVRGKAARNDFGFALQSIDPARLDVQLNRERANGVNRIVMGVEIDDYDRPVQYHLLSSRDIYHRTYQVVPASEIIHWFVQDDAEQTRGYPWAHSAIIRLHHLKGYEEAAIIAARVGAAKMGFFVSTDGDASGLADGEDDEGEFYTDAEAGTFGVVPQGYDFKTYDPAYPHEQYESFVKRCLRGISSGLSVAYNSLSGDLEGVNFSSIRAGVLEERDQWTGMQGMFAESVLVPVFKNWLQMALLTESIVLASGKPLPITKIEKFAQHRWQGRRWAWVDPLKEMTANVLAIDNGLESPQNVIAGMGGDPESILRDLKQWGVMLANYGVSPIKNSITVVNDPNSEK